MDDDGGDDARRKELSISLAASSMINASDSINQDDYEMNLKRIQEVKEMVQRLELNNELAHKNFIVNYLEKRARTGRDAESMLSQLRSHPGLPESIHFTNTIPNRNPELILPTSATLVEVPESPSSPSFPSTSTTIPTQQIHPAEYRWNTVPQPQSYQSGAIPYYTPSPTTRPRYSVAPRSQAPANGRMGWHISPDAAPQFGTHHPSASISSFQPTHVQQPTQVWNNHSHNFMSLPAPHVVPGSYVVPPAWPTVAPPLSSSSAMYRDPKLPTQPVVSALPANIASSQLHNAPLHASTVQVPVYGVTPPVAKASSSQLPVTRAHAQPAGSQFISTATTVSIPASTSNLQWPHQQVALTQPPHQQHPQPSQPQRYPQELPSQRPLPPQKHRQTPVQQAGHVSSISQALSQPSRRPDSLPSASAGTSQSQPRHPAVTQEQAQPRDAQFRADQATFIKIFQAAVQRGSLHLKAFLLRARACGISEDWFKAAFNSISREALQSITTQANQLAPVVDSDVLSSANVPHAVPALSTTPSNPSPVQPTGAPQPMVEPNPLAKANVARSVEGETSQSYAAQLQYYAEQATRSAQVAGTPPGNTSSTPNVIATHRPLAQVNVRTPKDANKSTLARDILRSLGKMVQEPSAEMGSEPMDGPGNEESDQLPAINIVQDVSESHDAASSDPNPPLAEVPPVVYVQSPSALSVEPSAVAAPQQITPTSSFLKEESRIAVDGRPIMIDLTLDDSDESVYEKRQEHEPTLPVQTTTATSASLRPAPPTDTTTRAPLLGNLSLEDRPVDNSADGHSEDADVRMYSPPSSMRAEENMESELLSPQLDAMTLGSPSSEPLPREASSHLLDGPLPLFLPSPPVSPAAHTEPPETDLEVLSEDGNSRFHLKRLTSNVDEQEVTPVAPRVKKRRKQAYVLIPPAPLYVKRAIKKMKERVVRMEVDSEVECVGEAEEFQYSPLEQLLVEESKSRLLERRCRWMNCGAILNCATNLFVHLKAHAREEDSKAPFFCRWLNCRRQFSTRQERDIHLEKHTIRPLPCPFAGCDEQFNKPAEVMQHEVQHQQTKRAEHLMRKPTCQAVVPAIPAQLGLPPERLPSHRVIPRRVVKCRISAERHATMGPWVLWNIFSPVELSTRKQNATMRGRQMRQYDGSDVRRDDYDFLLSLSACPTGKNPELDELDSSMVTMSAARGLTLWGDEPGTEEEDVERMLIL